MGRKVPVICFGIGALTPDSVLIQTGFVNAREAARLKAMGAVGDILSRFIDGNGNVVDHELDSRTIGASLESCRDRELSIGVAAGSHKTPSILACLRAKYINALITDEMTARKLLETTDHE
jgi:deoxyribonucleoside regulator